MTEEPVRVPRQTTGNQAWARVATDTTTDRQVTQGGDRRLWDELEAAHDLWKQLGTAAP